MKITALIGRTVWSTRRLITFHADYCSLVLTELFVLYLQFRSNCFLCRRIVTHNCRLANKSPSATTVRPGLAFNCDTDPYGLPWIGKIRTSAYDETAWKAFGNSSSR